MDANAIGVRGIIAVLRRRIRLIVITAASIVLLTGLILLSLTPIYSASALLLVDPAPVDLLAPAHQNSNPSSDSARIDNAVEILRSDALLLAVIEAKDLATDPHFNGPSGPIELLLSLWPSHAASLASTREVTARVLSNLRAAITVQRRGLTYMIAIQARAPEPAQAAALANALAQTYLDWQIATKTADIHAARTAIETRLAAASTALNDSLTPQPDAQQLRLDQILRTSPREFKFEPEPGPLPATTQQLSPLQTQLTSDAARREYQRLLDRYWDLSSQAELQVADATIISPALTPIAPSFPNKTTTLLLAGLAALGASIGLAFLYENYIGGFTSSAQVQAVLPTRLSSSVPPQKSGSKKISLANLVVTAPLSTFAEAIRRLRIIVDHATQDRSLPSSNDASGRIIMVCSASPGEGKTTLALALARSYALLGRRTLLVDADLRKPTLFKQLGAEPGPGLLEFLSSGEDNHTGPNVAKDPASATMVIVGTQPSVAPTDQLFAGPVFAHLLQAARSTFDVIILDTPPIGAASDALAIASQADAIVFVTLWANTPQSVAHEAFSSLTEAKAPRAEIITVVNKQDASGARYAHTYGDDYATV